MFKNSLNVTKPLVATVIVMENISVTMRDQLSVNFSMNFVKPVSKIYSVQYFHKCFNISTVV